MNKQTKTAMLVAGGMIALGTLTYCLLPKRDKKELKGMMSDLSYDNLCNCMNCSCDK